MQVQPGSIQALTVRCLPLPCGHEELETEPTETERGKNMSLRAESRQLLAKKKKMMQGRVMLQPFLKTVGSLAPLWYLVLAKTSELV